MAAVAPAAAARVAAAVAAGRAAAGMTAGTGRVMMILIRTKTNQRLQGALATTTGASGSRLSDDGVGSLPSPLVQLERWVCGYQTLREEEALLVQRVGSCWLRCGVFQG